MVLECNVAYNPQSYFQYHTITFRMSRTFTTLVDDWLVGGWLGLVGGFLVVGWNVHSTLYTRYTAIHSNTARPDRRW